MNDTMIATHLENLDRRLARVEQILPTLATKYGLKTLATKDEFHAAVALLATKDEFHAAVALLATKDELHAAVALLATKAELEAAIAPLPTKEEMRREIREEGERSRRYMDVIGEGLRGDIQLLAEHLSKSRP